MESNFFRCLIPPLSDALVGARVQKVFEPASGTITLQLQGRQGGGYLLFRPHRELAALFISEHKPANPSQPDARTMWLRRRIINRRILSVKGDWCGRRLSLELSPSVEREGRFLLLDLRQGWELVEELELGFGSEPEWPAMEDARKDPELWRIHPQISPTLRKALTGRDLDQAWEVYESVLQGECNGFRVYSRDDQPRHCLPYSLPGDHGMDVIEFSSALDAAQFAGERLIFPAVRGQAESFETRSATTRKKQLRRLLKKLQAEEDRLAHMAGLLATAEELKAHLWSLPAAEKLHEIRFEIADGVERVLPLVPTITVTENMARLYAQAAKGKRGLEQVADRLREVREELDLLESGRLRVSAKLKSLRERRETAKRGNQAGHVGFKGVAVSMFRTSDGFIALRGKNAKANHQLLDKVSPFDLWFHAQDRPGAHVILRRDHPNQDIPERSRLEAAALAGLKSGYAGGGKASVICALVKDVRKVKGAPLGQVRVDQMQESLTVLLEPGMEERLLIQG